MIRATNVGRYGRKRIQTCEFAMLIIHGRIVKCSTVLLRVGRGLNLCMIDDFRVCVCWCVLHCVLCWGALRGGCPATEVGARRHPAGQAIFPGLDASVCRHMAAGFQVGSPRGSHGGAVGLWALQIRNLIQPSPLAHAYIRTCHPDNHIMHTGHFGVRGSKTPGIPAPV